MANIIYPNQNKYLSNNKKPLNKILSEIEEYAKNHRIPILDWNSAEFLEQLVLIKNPRSVLEIGTAIGYSTIRIAKVSRDGCFIDTIEKSEKNIKVSRDFFKKSRLSKKIRLLEGEAKTLLKSIKQKYDLIFLDADKEDYEQLFKISISLLKTGGIYFVDNLLWHGYPASEKVPKNYKISTEFIRRFNRLFISNKQLNTTILPIGDGIGLGIKIK
ncbi:O-methyltransferase [Bacteroidota bacterium]